MHQNTKIRDLARIHSGNTDLIASQLLAMSRQIPLLYLIVSINVMALSVSFFGDAPDYLTLWLPGALVSVFILRSVIWWRRADPNMDNRTGVRQLTVLSALMVLMSLILTVWCFALYPYGDAYQQSHVAFFIALTLIGTLFAVIQLPPAAIGCMVVSGTGFVLFFSTRGHLVFDIMALSFVFVLFFAVLMVRNYFDNQVRYLASNSELSNANEELSELYEELKYHRDHLADEVTKRTKELEEQKLKLEQALQAERRVTEMQNKFVAMVSHEFRTPLAVIDGMARRVERRAGEMEPEKVQDRMEKIRGAVSRLSGMVERTLDASKLASGSMDFDPRPYDPNALLLEIVDRQKEIATDVSFNLDLEALPKTMTGDTRLMDHVLTNLISNAVKYSGSDPRLDIRACRQDQTVQVIIRDNGVGIPKEELKRVGDRFFRASTSTGIQGTGIGLNLVDELVKMHGGTFRIDSEVGEWTEVTVSVPVHAVARNDDADVSALGGMSWET